MRFTAALFIGTAMVAPALAATDMPTCVKTCFDGFPTSSFCDGDETGDALADCTCATLTGSQVLKCIKACPTSDQDTYAKVLPPKCAEKLFPGSGGGDDTTSSSSTAEDTKTGDAASKTADASSTNTADATAGTTAAAATTTTSGDEKASQTETASESSSPSATADKGGLATGVKVPMALAVGGLLAAFFV